MNVEKFGAQFDPFADEGFDDDINDVGSQQNVIHLRLQQRNGRKTLTIIEGLPREYESDPDELSQVFKNEFKCGGSVVKTKDKAAADEKEDTPDKAEGEEKGEKSGEKKKKESKKKVRRGDKIIAVKKLGGKTCEGVIQLQGDHRTEIQVLLISKGFPEDKIMIHGT